MEKKNKGRKEREREKEKEEKNRASVNHETTLDDLIHL